MKFGTGFSTRKAVVSNEECQRYRRDSIAIQPINKPIQNRPVTYVINDGIDKMRQDKFNLAKGFDDV